MGRLAKRNRARRKLAGAVKAGESRGWEDTVPPWILYAHDIAGGDVVKTPPSRPRTVVPPGEGAWALTLPGFRWIEGGLVAASQKASGACAVLTTRTGNKLHRWSFRVDSEVVAIHPTPSLKSHGQPVAWEDRDKLAETSAREDAVISALARAQLEGVLVYGSNPWSTRLGSKGVDLPLVRGGPLAHWVAKTTTGSTTFVCGGESGSDRLPLAPSSLPLCSACEKAGQARGWGTFQQPLGYNQWLSVKIPVSIHTLEGDVEHPTLVCPGWDGGEWVEVSDSSGYLIDSGLRLIVPRESGVRRRLAWMLELDRRLRREPTTSDTSRTKAWRRWVIHACREARRERWGLVALRREGTFVLAFRVWGDPWAFSVMVWKEGHLAFRKTWPNLGMHSPRLSWSTDDPILAAALQGGALEWEGDTLVLGQEGLRGTLGKQSWSAGTLSSESPFTPRWSERIVPNEGQVLEVVYWTRLHFNPWEEAPQPGRCSLRGEGGEVHRLGVFVVPEGDLSGMWRTGGRDVKVTARVPIREGRVLVSRIGRIVGDWIDSPDEALLADDDNALVVVGWDPRWVTDVEYWEVPPAPLTRRPWEKTAPTLQRTALPKSWF